MQPEPRSLFGRMVATLVALLVLDALFVAVVVALLLPWIAIPARAAGFDAGWRVWLGVGALLVLVALPVAAWLQLRYARRRLLAAVDGTRVTPESHPDLDERFRRLAALADVPTPRLVVAPSGASNSFAVGGPDSATVVVTRGLIEELPADELETVLAHELAHVKNRDTTVMTLVSLLPALLAAENPFSEWVAAKSGLFWTLCAYLLVTALALGATAGPVAAGALIVFVVSIALGSIFLGVLAAPALVLGYRLSWDREFVADRAAARLTGDPAALASALERLSDRPSRPATDARLAGQLRPLCLIPFDSSGSVPLDAPTHPPATRRIERLRSVSADLET